jgi:hypothetical protein
VPAGTPAVGPGRSELHLYRNHEALGRANVVTRLAVFEDEAAALRRMASPDYDPAHESCVTTAAAAELAAAGFRESVAAPTETRLVAATPDRLRFRCSGGGGLLVGSDCWYPGWRARIDGRDTPIVRVDHALRGVVLPAGDHEVEFAYVPRPLIAGLFLAPVAFAVLLFAALLLGRRRRRDVAAAAAVAARADSPA